MQHEKIQLQLGYDINYQTLLDQSMQQRIQQIMLGYLENRYPGDKITVEFKVEVPDADTTPRKIDLLKAEEFQKYIENTIHNDENLKSFINEFNAIIIPGSIKPRKQKE